MKVVKPGELEFLELHHYRTGDPILIRKNEVKSIYLDNFYNPPCMCVDLGKKEFYVEEDYNTIKGMMISPAVI